MNKVLWAPAGIALLGVAGIVSAFLIASSRNDNSAVRQVEAPTPTLNSCDPRAVPPDKQLWRWMDLVVLLPKEGFAAHPGHIPPDPERPNGGEGLATYKFDPEDPSNPKVGASLLIDAKTGAVVHGGGPEHGKATGIALCPFDPATAPWPYNGDPPDDWKVAGVELAGKWPYTPPGPGSGMYAEYSVGAAGCSGVCPWVECEMLFEAIGVFNGRSHAFIGMDHVSGAICKDLSIVLPEDLPAFQRFLDHTEQCMLAHVEC